MFQVVWPIVILCLGIRNFSIHPSHRYEALSHFQYTMDLSFLFSYSFEGAAELQMLLVK